MEQAMQQKAKVLADIEDAKKAQAAANVKSEEAFSQVVNDWNKKIAALQSQFSNVQADYNKKVVDAEADFAGRVLALEAEVKELEKRKAAAEKALDALRSKLG